VQLPVARRKVAPQARDTRGDDIESWYRSALSEPAVLPWAGPDTKWKPNLIGLIWSVDETGRWVLPERTLGWEMLRFSGLHFQEEPGLDWQWTLEQARIILWWYAVDDRGRFLFRDGVIQRLKGWGKDPLGAGIAIFELVGDCRVKFAESGEPTWRPDGNPVACRVASPWVQMAAVTQSQTRNTMQLLPGLVKPASQREFSMSIQKEMVYALGSTAVMQALTSSPSALEGNRPTFVLLNETHLWLANNNGHAMSAVLRRNSTKAKRGATRTLRITNAYEDGQDSIAERDRVAYEDALADRAASVGLFYDSVEASPDAPLTAESAPEVINSVRGDSVWLDIESIVLSILDVRVSPGESRRFWFNQIEAAADAWCKPEWITRTARRGEIVAPGERIVLFFDGSKSDDTTALVGCRISDGFVFVLGVWGKPPGWPKEGPAWRVNRDEVSLRIDEAFEAYRPIIFWGDPSDVREDGTDERYWEATLDHWHRKYGSRLDPRFWAVKTGDKTHSIIWDMRSPERQKMFVAATELTISEIEHREFLHDGSQVLLNHVKAARRRPGKYGVGIGKSNRESSRKIDAAVCMVGARMARRAFLNAKAEEQRTGRVY